MTQQITHVSVPENTRRHRCLRLKTAFTLVELLAVIAIIGTLVGLLLPARSTRAASR